VRALIISDLHANMEAVSALPSDYDQLWVLGDLVNYGPDPAAVIQFARDHAAIVVRGNHDHAIGFDEDPRCSPRFRAMAEEMRRYTMTAVSEDDRRYLRNLPLKTTLEATGTHFLMCHAVPSDPLYEYRREDSPMWLTDEPGSSIDIELVGHTHLPFRRSLRSRLIVNPGSVGQPKHGTPEACYAIWENGRITLGSLPYDVEAVVAKLRCLPISAEVFEDLAFVLRHGTIPSS